MRSCVPAVAASIRRPCAVADFAAALLELAEVAVVPGVAFGLSPAFRLSFAAADDVLQTALGRIAEVIASLR